MTAYYNENDPYAAAWLRTLIAAGHIADGDVDERSIADVSAADLLAGYTQCHFFAGIGGWSYALRLAGWPDDRPVWTGSCPCQPFSAAGKGRGFADDRHLWPVWFELIRECAPRVVFGEQVDSPAGRSWLDDVLAGLEAAGYAWRADSRPACSVGAPHHRRRLWFAATAVDNPNGDGFAPRLPASPIMGHGAAAVATSWDDFRLVRFTDGCVRAVATESSAFPLAHGVPARVGRLRAYGNAIVPQVAAQFIGAYIDGAGEAGR